MLSKCANPGCSAPFLYLHHGQLFRVEVERAAEGGPSFGADPELKRPSRGTEYFWLCDDCAPLMTLRFKRGSGVITEPLAKAKAAAL